MLPGIGVRSQKIWVVRREGQVQVLKLKEHTLVFVSNLPFLEECAEQGPGPGF
jgi:hypothetical protein